jgi:glutathione peroxidase
MRLMLSGILLWLNIVLLGCSLIQPKKEAEVRVIEPGTMNETSSSIYDYSFTTLDGKKISLSRYKGMKMLIVNTASECGYTPQYEGLQKLYEKYKGNLVVIGFPTNDFGQQEPGENEEIQSFCSKNYKVTFPMSQKVTVKGEAMHPIYKWLTQKSLNGKLDSEVKWNFQKYLIDETGQLVAVYKSSVKPEEVPVGRE